MMAPFTFQEEEILCRVVGAWEGGRTQGTGPPVLN